MSATWRCSPSVRASVNGTVKTVGRRPAASCAAKVAPFHAYSTGLTAMFGCCFSNNATLSLNCFCASSELPGRSAATLIVTFACEPAVAIEAAPTTRNSAAATTRSVIALKLDFIVLPFRGVRDRPAATVAAAERGCRHSGTGHALKHVTVDKSTQEIYEILQNYDFLPRRAASRGGPTEPNG